MLITITRSQKHKYGLLRKLSVIINNNLSGTLKVGESKTFIVDDTPAEVYVSMDWCRSPTIRVTEDTELLCGDEGFLHAFKMTFTDPSRVFLLHKV